MGQHATHIMHTNSIDAYKIQLASGKKLTRSQLIIDLLLQLTEPQTDREIMIALGFTDMNSIRPRVTELIKNGTLEECGKVKDQITGLNVRRVRIKRELMA